MSLVDLITAMDVSAWVRFVRCAADMQNVADRVVADKHLSRIQQVVGLVQDEELTDREPGSAAESDLHGARAIASGPRGQVLRASSPIEAPLKTDIGDRASRAATSRTERRSPL